MASLCKMLIILAKLFFKSYFSNFYYSWAAFLSISLLASVFPVSLPLFFLFLRPCLIHARLPEGGRAFVHGHTFLHSWSGPMTVVIGLLHGATFLSNLPLVLFVSFIGPLQLERTPNNPHLQLQSNFYSFRLCIFCLNFHN